MLSGAGFRGISSSANTLFGGVTAAHANIVARCSTTGCTLRAQAVPVRRFKAISSVPTPLAALIGPAGSTAFPFRCSCGNLIGGAAAGAGNTVAYHSVNGVRSVGVRAAATTRFCAT